MKIKKILSLVLVVVMLLSMVACGSEKPAETTVAADLPEINGEMTYFSLTMGEDYENIHSLTAYPEDGNYFVEVTGEERKMGYVDASAGETILAALKTAGLLQLNGQDIYDEGDANASMYITFSDEQMFMVGYSGNIAEAFVNGFEIMEKCLQEVAKDLPVYVPEPVVAGDIAEDDLAVLNQILDNMTLAYADGYMITPVAKDEFFAETLGLTSGDGIDRAVSFAPMMMTSAYFLNILFLEDGADADAICADFQNSIDWRKWVCVAPDHALVAVKDGMVLCLMGGDVYDQTKNAIEDTDWTILVELDNPDM